MVQSPNIFSMRLLPRTESFQDRSHSPIQKSNCFPSGAEQGFWLPWAVAAKEARRRKRIPVDFICSRFIECTSYPPTAPCFYTNGALRFHCRLLCTKPFIEA